MKPMGKNADIFICNICDFKCYKKCNYKSHLLTTKHINRTNVLDLEQKTSKARFICRKCNKQYNARNSLWYHEKKCNHEKQQTDECKDKDKDKDNIINLLLTQNKELMDLIKSGIVSNNTTNNNTCNTTNNNNNTFNLNVFLNETCKDAMNITDFVSSIQLNLDDLEKTGRTGYVEGISSIVINNLNKLENHLRPLHCSDFKREVLYIKDNNEWCKEDENKDILTNAIKIIANKNIKQISKWKDNYPDCIKSNSKKNDLYLKIVSNSMNGLTKEEGEKNIHKIISNVVKNVVINKQNILE